MVGDNAHHGPKRRRITADAVVMARYDDDDLLPTILGHVEEDMRLLKPSDEDAS